MANSVLSPVTSKSFSYFVYYFVSLSYYYVITKISFSYNLLIFSVWSSIFFYISLNSSEKMNILAVLAFLNSTATYSGP